MKDLRGGNRRWLLLVFVLSGFAGLIYQSIWSQYIGLFLGHAAYAQALVLALFMGGMAFGAALVAKAGERWRNLVRLYALVELAIGVLGLLFHFLYVGLTSFGYDVLIPASGSIWAVNLVKWGIAALLILPQTILLGMTFPLMSGGIIRRFPGRDGDTLGGLYFTNSIGAALGALVATFLLLPTVGLPGSTVTAGVLNLVVAAIALWLARSPEPDASVTARAESAAPRGDSALLRLVLVATAVSGAVSFVYELVWIRMLSLAVGGTLHAFELMLASFIAGIAFGGLWIRRRADRSAQPLRLGGWMQLGKGLAALASLVVFSFAFEWVGWIVRALAASEQGYDLFNLATALIAIAIMMPAAFFAGTTLPLLTVVLLRDGQGERAIGRVYAWNTVGAIVGVFLAIHVLVPGLGLKLALCAAALADLALGVWLLRWRAASKPEFRAFAVAGGVAALALGLAIALVRFDPLVLASGVFRSGVTTLGKERKVFFYRDGKTASVSVFSSPDGTLSIATNGKVDASIVMVDGREISNDEMTMALAAAVPLSMHANPRRIGVIGFGSGMTTHTLLADPRVERVDTVEIERMMVEGARYFGDRVARAYEDPRSRVVIDDAKSYFSAQHDKYDIIVSEPSNPWISGVGALFSEEFYRFVPRNLDPGGLFVQWVQLYEIDERLVSSIISALAPAFDDYAIWLSNNGDMIIVASPEGPLPPIEPERLFGAPAMRADLAKLHVDAPEQLLQHRVGDARIMRAMTRLYQARANSDYRPVLSIEAPETRFRRQQADAFATLPLYAARVLDALGVRAALPASVRVSAFADFYPNAATTRARGFAMDLLESQRFAGAERSGPARWADASLAALLRESFGSDCAASWTAARTEQVALALYRAAELSASFLDAATGARIWKERPWVGCPDALPERANQVFDLIAASAVRDYAAMAGNGEAWLRSREAHPQWAALDEFALTGVLLAAAHEGDWAGVVRSEQELGRNVHLEDARKQMHALLLSLADDGKAD